MFENVDFHWVLMDGVGRWERKVLIEHNSIELDAGEAFSSQQLGVTVNIH